MNKNLEELIGKRFNRLTVISLYGKDKKYNKLWLCKCDCGNKIIVNKGNLKNENTKSCGCLHSEIVSTHRKSKTKFYSIWVQMKQRCNNINNKGYHKYGGRGIFYSLNWENFLNFKKDMYFKYLYVKKQLKVKRPSIERKDNNGNYCKENCTFIELKDQGKNTRLLRKFKAISPSGEIYFSNHQTAFARKYNLNSAHICSCLSGSRKMHKDWLFELL
jgi:hypothetical protein